MAEQPVPSSQSNLLVLGVSSRALFDLEDENRLFALLGRKAYADCQIADEHELLRPGTAFPFVKGLLSLNKPGTRLVDICVISHNNPETGLRVMKSISAHGLDIPKAYFVGDDPLNPYLKALKVDLFLSPSVVDVQAAVDADIPAAIVYRPPTEVPKSDILRIAFDADAVLFSDESEQLFREKGIDSFLEHERANVDEAMATGPFAQVLMKLAAWQRSSEPPESLLRIAIITARDRPAGERVIKTLRAWGVTVDAAFFLGGTEKEPALRAFGAHIFFDDQTKHLAPSSSHTPCARVPYKTDSPLWRLEKTEREGEPV